MKKFNAKRTTVKIGYEFLDGSELTVSVQSLSTSEFEELDHMRSETTFSGSDVNKKAVRILLAKNDDTTVEKIIDEQYNNGSLGEFVSELFKTIDEEKMGKLNGSHSG